MGWVKEKTANAHSPSGEDRELTERESHRQNNGSPAGGASSPFPIQSSSAEGKAVGKVGLEMSEVTAIKTTL